MSKILMIAFEDERWGPVRLPRHLNLAGAEVAALCPPTNPLCQTASISRHYSYQNLKSAREFARQLGAAMTDWKPDLVMPCDEPVVVMLHYLLRNRSLARRYMTKKFFDTLQMSIGAPDKLDAMVLKYHTRLLAEEVGVQVPHSELVTSAASAVIAAKEIGYPVYFKKSFSWAGQGTVKCHDKAEVAAKFDELNAHTPWYKQFARKLLSRDWFPVNTPIELQGAVEGEAVMYCVAALEGRFLGGFFANRAFRTNANGPSTVVNLGEHDACRRAAEKMVAGMKASGFLAFDFMICEKTGEAFLLECNPRPNQIFHLGEKIGTNLCVALVAALMGRDVAKQSATKSKTVALFPQEWFRSETAALANLKQLDMPLEDGKLMDYIYRIAKNRGISSESLTSAIANR